MTGTTGKKERAEMEMSTLAKLVIILVVLAVVLLFFVGGFKTIGTGKFVAVANNSTSSSGFDMNNFLNGMSGYF